MDASVHSRLTLGQNPPPKNDKTDLAELYGHIGGVPPKRHMPISLKAWDIDDGTGQELR